MESVKRKRKFIVLVLLSLYLAASGLGQDYQFDLLEDRKRAIVPFRYVHNFILVRVRMFDLLPLYFLVDTGAEHTILFKKEITDVFNIPYDRRVPIVGSDLSRELYALICRNVSVQVEGLPLQQQDILVLEENVFRLEEITGTRIDGILGGSFFKQHVLRIDYRRQKLIVLDPQKFENPGDDYCRIPLDIRHSKPYLNAEGTLLDGSEVSLELLIDTGAGLPLLLHNNTHPSLKLPENHIRGDLGYGLGGTLEGYIGRIKHLSIDDRLIFDLLLTRFQDLSDNVLLDNVRFRNGLIGNQMLSRFFIYIDYVREVLYLRPRKKFKRNFNMDKSGLIIFAAGRELNEFVIQSVIEDSPAAEADIRPGDVITRIQGFPSRFYTLDHISHILQKKTGKKIRLTVKRGDVEIKKRFRLRELI